MDRTETLVVGAPPERRQAEVRKRQEFGWVLATAHEEAVLKGNESRKELKLVFTRSGSEERLSELKNLEQEWEAVMKSVVLDEMGRIVSARRPLGGIPWPLVAAAAIGTGGLFWALLDILAGAVGGLIGGTISYVIFKRRSDAAMAEYSTRVDGATVAFHKRQKEILVRARAVVHAVKV